MIFVYCIIMKKAPKEKSIEEEYGITDPVGNDYEIPLQGSIGLLVLGYRGLMAWRAKKIEAERKLKQKKSESEPGE
jgi:hypothetical protein